MPRNMKIALGILAIAVLVGLINLHSLRERVRRLAEMRSSEEQARHEVLAPPIFTPTDVTVKAKIFWAAGPDKIAPVEIDLPLSADPVERSKQLLHTLIAAPPNPGARTIPADAVLLDFYVLPDGTAIADFSDALTAEMPSGILSEEMAVDSIAQTLESNVPILRRLKIVIHGQEVDTLAGNVDLTGFFDLNPLAPQANPGAPRSQTLLAPSATTAAMPPH
jgi:hypothetical protein